MKKLSKFSIASQSWLSARGRNSGDELLLSYPMASSIASNTAGNMQIVNGGVFAVVGNIAFTADHFFERLPGFTSTP